MLGTAVALWAESARGSPIGWIGLAGAAPLIVIIVLTQSRGAFLAVATMALPSAIALARGRPRAVMAFAALVPLALNAITARGRRPASAMAEGDRKSTRLNSSH